MEKEQLTEMVYQCILEVLTEVGKRDFINLFLKIHPSDRKTIKYWRVEDQGNVAVVELYTTLVGQGFLETISEFVARNNGDFRMFPSESLLCIQMTFPVKKV